MHSKQIFSFQKPHYRPTLALARNFSFRQGNALVFTIVRCAHIDSCSCLAFMLKEYQVCGAVRQQGDEHAHTSSLKHRAPYSCHSAILCGFSLSHKKSDGQGAQRLGLAFQQGAYLSVTALQAPLGHGGKGSINHELFHACRKVRSSGDVQNPLTSHCREDGIHFSSAFGISQIRIWSNTGAAAIKYASNYHTHIVHC